MRLAVGRSFSFLALWCPCDAREDKTHTKKHKRQDAAESKRVGSDDRQHALRPLGIKKQQQEGISQYKNKSTVVALLFRPGIVCNKSICIISPLRCILNSIQI